MCIRPTALAGLLLAGLLGALGTGCEDTGPARSEDPSVAIAGVHPRFDPSVSRYVARCGRGAPPILVRAQPPAAVAVGSARPRSGSFRVDRAAAPGADFAIRVDESGGRETYRVRCLPAGFPRWRFERFGATPPGLFVVSFNAPGGRPWIVVFDHQGTPRWWLSPGTRALWAQILRDGTVAWARSFGDGYGLDPRMAHEVRTLSGRLRRMVRTEGAIVDGHEFHELANGNVLVDAYVPGGGLDLRRFGGSAGARAVFAEIQELDPEGRVVWRWNSRPHIGLGETGRWWRNVLSNPKSGADGAQQFDPVHINSIEPARDGEIVMSTRHTDAVYGIDRATGRITWKLGGTRTPESLRVLGDPATLLFGGQHDARLGPDGTLSVFDNGKDRPRLPRVAFYRLDREDRTATYLGQLNDPRVDASHCCGSARPLAGGGWLVSWGDNPVVSAFDGEERLSFRLTMAAPSFRAVPVPRGAVGVKELDEGLEAMEGSLRD
jgi:hypothetical protein